MKVISCDDNKKESPARVASFFEPQRRGLISLDLNEKAHRRKRRWAFKNRVGAAGFEPDDPTAPRNERSFYDKSTVVKECVLVRHCEATSHRAVAFGLEESARWPYGVPNLADIKERMWVAHCLQFRRPSSLPKELLGFEGSLAKYPKSHSNSS
jgi:hypothetical protein